MLQVRLPTGVVQWPAAELVSAVSTQRIDPLTPVSFDAGATWTTAAAASKRLAQQPADDRALAALVPVRVEPLSLIAGYVAVLTFFFFGGPAVFIGTLFAWDTGPTLAVRAAGVLVAAVLGPLPPALFGRAALRALAKDPTLRGRGRAVFALVVAGLLTLPLLAGLVFLVVR